MRTDEKAVHELLRVATRYIPTRAYEFLGLFRHALPALAGAETMAKEQALLHSLGAQRGGWTDPKCKEIVFGSLVRALLRFTPEGQKAIVEAAWVRLSPLAEKAAQLKQMHAVVEAAIDSLRPQEKALFAAFWSFSRVDGVANSHFVAAFDDLQDGPVDVLRKDPRLAGFTQAHDLAVVVYEACEACR